MRLKPAYIAVLLIFCLSKLPAQRVLYSPVINYYQADHFEPLGKAGNHYWLQRYRGKERSLFQQHQARSTGSHILISMIPD